MNDLLQKLKYTKTHEWILRDDKAPNGTQNIIKVGITDFAQQQLSDITYVELPAVGRQLSAGEEVAVVESIKAAADVYAPAAGSVVEVNAALANAPEAINSDPYGQGWLFTMKLDNQADINALMDASQYEASLSGEH